MTSDVLQRWTRHPIGRGAALLAVPLALNLVIYVGAVRPLRARVTASRQARVLNELKPMLESALTESGQILTVWRRTGFSTSDASTVMQTLQQLATTHGVRIATLDSAAQITAGGTSIPLELAVSGRFGRLAHWMEDLETRSGFRIESWTLTRGQDARDPEQLAIKLTAFLQGAS